MGWCWDFEGLLGILLNLWYVLPFVRNRQAQVVYGECQQQYLPVRLLVAPPYPGAVLAYDFVLVESGCQVAAHVAQHYGETQPREAQRLGEDMTTVRESDRRLFWDQRLCSDISLTIL